MVIGKASFLLVLGAAIIALFPSQPANADTNQTNPHLNRRPYRVLWNYPDLSCGMGDYAAILSEFGIVVNSPRNFVGDQIATLYVSRYGLWPRFENGNINSPINGGIPQKANLTAHLNKLRHDIAADIKDDWTGYAVLDQELWRIIFDFNYGGNTVYKTASFDFIKSKHPGVKFTFARLMELGRSEWEPAASEFMRASLVEARAVRPNVHWGYYLYPQTWWSSEITVRNNDKMAPVFEASTGLYPSIYIKNDAIANIPGSIRDTLAEAIRVRALHTKQYTPIVAYTSIEYGYLFPKNYLEYAIGMPAEMGLDAAVIWGSSMGFMGGKIVQKCNELKTYVRNVLGPYFKELRDRLTECSEVKCGGHGRCVRKDYAQSVPYILGLGSSYCQVQIDVDTLINSIAQDKFENYVCQCFDNGQSSN